MCGRRTEAPLYVCRVMRGIPTHSLDLSGEEIEEAGERDTGISAGPLMEDGESKE